MARATIPGVDAALNGHEAETPAAFPCKTPGCDGVAHSSFGRHSYCRECQIRRGTATPDGRAVSGLIPTAPGSRVRTGEIRTATQGPVDRRAFLVLHAAQRVDHAINRQKELKDKLHGALEAWHDQTSNTFSDIAPAWSPDGRRSSSRRNRDGNTEIYTMNADRTDQTRLTTYPGRDQDPDWSPNGRTIALERDVEPIADLTLQVFVMNADGTDPTQLTGLQLPSGPSENSHPGWGRGRVLEP